MASWKLPNWLNAMATRCCAGTGRVCGEVYRIPAHLWPALDAWEEVPSVYQRRRHSLLDGRRVWVYEAP